MWGSLNFIDIIPRCHPHRPRIVGGKHT
jgi:hypothetical protein